MITGLMTDLEKETFIHNNIMRFTGWQPNWSPFTNREQAFNVIEKIGADGKKKEYLTALIAAKSIGGRQPNIWDFLVATPRELMEAALEAYR